MISPASLPPGLATLARRLNFPVDGWVARQRLEIRVDKRFRITMRHGRRTDDVLLESRLVPLPDDVRDREDLIDRVMLHVTATAGRFVGVVTVSPDGRQLLLQSEVQGGNAERFSSDLEAFLNEIDYWNAIVRLTDPR